MVFIESDIADIVEAVFNGPMATIEGEESFRRSILRRKTRNAIDRFVGNFL